MYTTGRQHLKAFTLLELLVVLGLLSSLLIMMMLSDGNNIQVRRENTRNNINEIYQMFMTARSNAVTSTTVASDTVFTPENGFGVNIHLDHANIENSVFTLFADTDDGDVGTPEGEGDDVYSSGFASGNDILFGDFQFPLKDGKIVEFTGSPADGSPQVDFLASATTDVAILFRPPSAEVIIKDNDGIEYKSFFLKLENEGVFGESLSLERAQRFVNRQRTFP